MATPFAERLNASRRRCQFRGAPRIALRSEPAARRSAVIRLSPRLLTVARERRFDRQPLRMIEGLVAMVIRGLVAVGLGLALAPASEAQTIYPIDRAAILEGAKFDFKVEFAQHL